MVFDKLKLKKRGGDLRAAQVPSGAPSKRLIFQSRSNYGVNIGSCFINEKWIFDELFEDGTDVELDAVARSVKNNGKDGAKDKFQKHWKEFLSGDDWAWMKDHGVTSIRVPIGYWEIGGGQFAKGTKFDKYTWLYAEAWPIFKSHFVEPAADHDISVVVDVHGVPGGANGADHSGEKNGGSADFWNDFTAQLQMLDAYKFIAEDLKNYENIAAIQVVNESEYAWDAKRQKDFYAAAINLIREADDQIPVVISDGWFPQQWAEWVQEKQNQVGYIGVVIDHHLYRCFSDDDKKKLPQQIISDLDGDVLTNLKDNGKGVDYMVGEYSCVIDGQSWDRDGANNKRDELVINYGKRQVDIITQRATFGSYFWTYRFQSGNGGEWDFKTMTDKGAIACPIQFGGDGPDDNKFKEVFDNNFRNHVDYWNNADSKEKFEHDRYEDGFKAGWSDAKEFFKFNHSVLGRKEGFKLARLNEHRKAKGDLKHLWEFETGYDAGLNEFRNNL